MDNGTVPTQGWTSSPSGRGTLDIIWSCGLTVFLCSWSVLCLNVPPRDASKLYRLSRKVIVFCEGMVGPEFIFQTALSQWVSARRSIKAFQDSGYPQWSLSHAFFAEMGGYHLHPRDFVPFPLNAKQLHYLVNHGYLDFSHVAIGTEHIDEKNKSDGLTRLIIVLQILWFLINTLARALQGLAITTLELTTCGYIVCTLGIYICWTKKPLDVTVPVILVPKTTMADILIEAGPCAARPYSRTPMDFVGNDESSFSVYWTYWFTILANMGIRFHTRQRPIDKIPDDSFADLDAKTIPILILIQTGFAAVHISGWNFHFPTGVERSLWRISSVAIISAITLYWIADTYTIYIHPVLKRCWVAAAAAATSRLFFAKKNNNVQTSSPSSSVPSEDIERQGEQSQPQPSSSKSKSKSKFRARAQGIAQSLRNNSTNKDPDLDVPLKALIPLTPVAVVYCIARAYMVLEGFVVLRSLPSSAYGSVNWTSFLPHF